MFDCFGVLVREGWFAFLDTYFADDPNKHQQAVDGMSRMGSGLMGHDEFIAYLAELAGISYQATEDILTDNPPNENLFNYIEKSLKPHYKLAILSNAGADRTVQLFGAHRAGLFDAVVLSHLVGTVKPDPEIYRITAQKLGVTVGECLFIDDLQRYCDAALNVGMQAIVHDGSTSVTIAKIEEQLHA
ncbi:MAG: HAD-superfamily hydrolase, subfamily variant 3 [Candidatus Saccharibacteria bacterium]|nr:HAD-superfamily hydrolase, subfamily variant 3 [Candidatus Saccharibacteria bacterium]